MSGPDNRFQALARDAADRIAASRELADQLSLLPDERPGAALVAEDGRPKRGQGKALNQMREWLAARGYRLPEDVLSEMAGLASRDDVILTAMAQAERILAWAGKGSETATMRQRIDTFMQVYTLALRAADALMPYGAPKITPDTGGNTVVNQIVVQGAAQAPVSGPATARDVTPQGRRIAPPPMPGELKQNQQLSASVARASDGEDRTE